jgi:O-methyltransferase involved in polyketide biosynthesis
MALKAGHVNDFSNSMAEAIEIAMQQELAASGTALPAAGADDRRLLFVAIARGVLQYLKAHQTETFNSITFGAPPATGAVPLSEVELNYIGS